MIETLKKAHGDALAAVQMAEAEQELAQREWKSAIKAGADDAAIDAIDDRRRKAERTTERRQVAEQAAHDAVVAAEQAEQASERKAAADAFLLAHSDFAYRLAVVSEAAEKFVALVAALPADGGQWLQAMMRAKQLGALPSVSPLPVPADCLGAARKAANYAQFLQSRMA